MESKNQGRQVGYENKRPFHLGFERGRNHLLASSYHCPPLHVSSEGGRRDSPWSPWPTVIVALLAAVSSAPCHSQGCKPKISETGTKTEGRKTHLSFGGGFSPHTSPVCAPLLVAVPSPVPVPWPAYPHHRARAHPGVLRSLC